MIVKRLLQIAYVVLVVALFAWTIFAFRLPDGTIDFEGRVFLGICLYYIAFLPSWLIGLLGMVYVQFGLPYPQDAWIEWVFFLLIGFLGYFQWFWLLPLIFRSLNRLRCKVAKLIQRSSQ